MASTDQKTFRCELIGPTGKLLDCRTSSVVFPAHDGQVGVLYDHMPMLSQLGLGVVRVEPSPEGGPAGSEPAGARLFFVDGGFALVAENSVTVIAYDAMALQDATCETIRSMIERTEKSLGDPVLSPAQQAHENERLGALRRILESIRT
ncbi:MAG TPA: F0F1 ATP synthase subunit epsilon [Sedimentisphaerales bacterium]|jgi:F-type H+-transporting ATPase subunit epsilon|nr:F0F1 ATP synthase subunit epsilon [Sedimentisphaerales bacterium]HNU31270.1 F0F1 ATP synthase subunit epsilon [Sedimentisphaerales bacterium]